MYPIVLYKAHRIRYECICHHHPGEKYLLFTEHFSVTLFMRAREEKSH